MRTFRIAVALSVVALTGLAWRAYAAPGAYPNGTSVVETLHNLSFAASSNLYGAGALRDYGEVCVYWSRSGGRSDGLRIRQVVS